MFILLVDQELVQNKLNSPRNHELLKYLNWLDLLCLILLYISDFTIIATNRLPITIAK